MQTDIWGKNCKKRKDYKHSSCFKIIDQYRNAKSKEKTQTELLTLTIRVITQFTKRSKICILTEPEVIYVGFTLPDHQDIFRYIYIYIKLATIVEGDQEAPF